MIVYESNITFMNIFITYRHWLFKINRERKINYKKWVKYLIAPKVVYK